MPELHLAWLVLAAFIGIVAWAVINDVLSYRIPNIACAALVLLYPAWLLVAWPAADPWTTIALHLGVGLAALAAGFVLFILRAFGAGDAKLLAAVALWAGPVGILDLVLVTAIAGGILSLVIIIGRRLVQVWSLQLLSLQLMIGGLADRLLPRSQTAAAIEGAPKPRRGPANISFNRPIPYGIAIGAGAVSVAYGLLTTSGAA